MWRMNGGVDSFIHGTRLVRFMVCLYFVLIISTLVTLCICRPTSTAPCNNIAASDGLERQRSPQSILMHVPPHTTGSLTDRALAAAAGGWPSEWARPHCPRVEAAHPQAPRLCLRR